MERSFQDPGVGELELTRFRPREVQIWSVWLDAPESALAYYHASLSLEERNRAERFRFENLKRSHTLSRGVLRVLLAHYLGYRPKQIEFIYGPKGKPALRGSSRIRFNASHSADMALYAFTLDCELGLDVEKVRAIDDLETVASRFFCRAEVSELVSLRPVGRESAFFRCWTRKEAYVKAVGEGLSIPLDRFQVTLLPGDSARLIHIADGMQAARDWTLHHLDPAPGYIGALAYQGRPRLITVHPAVQAGELAAMLLRPNRSDDR